MRIQILIIVLSVLCSCSLSTEDSDSKNGQINRQESGRAGYTPYDSIRVNALFKKCDSLNNNNELEAALQMANKALTVSQKTGFIRGTAGARYRLGEVYLYMGKFSDALTALDESLPFYIKINDKVRIANIHNLKGNVYTDQGNKPEALNQYIAALKYYTAAGDKEGVAICHGNMGNINADMGRNAEALREYQNVLNISLEIGDKRMAAMTNNNMGTIYVSENNMTEALKQHQMSLKIKQEMGDKRGQSIAYNNIGSIYIMQGKYEDGLKLQTVALKLSEETGENDNAAFCLSNIGWAKIKLGQAAEAKVWINKGLRLAKELGSMETIVNCYNRLYEADSALGNFKGAFENNKLYNRYQDSLINEENIERTLESQIQYDFDKKEAQALAIQQKKDAVAKEELRRQKLMRNGFIGGFTVVMIFAFVFFNQKKKINKEKKKSDELLLNILPHEVAEELKEKGSADAQLINEVTILFTDFKGFTQLSEKLTPKELVGEINECFSAFDRIMEKYGVEKIKTIGDAYMAAGGLPTSNTTHAIDVVNAALAIQQYMLEHKEQKKAEGKLFFEIRIGVHSGPVVAGIVGVKKFAYDIWGDTVNTASRMESSGETGKVNISGTTYELVKDNFICSHRGKVQAKGKGEIDMYFVEGRI